MKTRSMKWLCSWSTAPEPTTEYSAPRILPPEHVDRAAGAGQLHAGAQIVGEYPEIVALGDLARQRQHGGSDVEANRLALPDETGGGLGNCRFLDCVAPHPLFECRLVLVVAQGRQALAGDGAAMRALKLAAAIEQADVAPDRHRRDAELFGKARHRNEADLLDRGDDVVAPDLGRQSLAIGCPETLPPCAPCRPRLPALPFRPPIRLLVRDRVDSASGSILRR